MAITKIGSRAIEDGTVAAADFAPGTISSAKLADDAVTNAKLSNSTISVGGTSTALGASSTPSLTDWQSVITSNTTMVSGRGYFVNTTSGAITMTLPSSANAGDFVSLKDYAETWDTNNCTIGRNSHNIQGVANDSTLTGERQSVTLVYVDSTKGWLYVEASTVDNLQGPLHTEATGGTVTTSGDFKIHTFTGDGNFVVSQVGNSPVPGAGPSNVDYLVVAGGGGGGANGGGGAGSGGYRTTFPSPSCNAGAFPVTTQTYPITVGGGGVDGGNNPGDPIGTNGSNSVFSTITSAGGGYGGSPVHTFCGSRSGNGNTGGSGGGGGSGPGSPVPNSGGAGNTPPVSPSQGNNGGNGSGGPNCGSASGGGGGSGGAGQNGVTPGSAPSSNMQGDGGAGTANSITGSPVTYAGGGGGQRAYTPGAGIQVPVGGAGAGGGGNGGATSAPPNTYVEATAGTANTGGGGGGGRGNGAGGTGGSGIVIIRYKYQN